MSSPILNTVNNNYNSITLQKKGNTGRPNTSLDKIFKFAQFLINETKEAGSRLTETMWSQEKRVQRAAAKGIKTVDRTTFKRSLAHITNCSSHSIEVKNQAKFYMENLVKPIGGKEIKQSLFCNKCGDVKTQDKEGVDNQFEFDIMDLDLDAFQNNPEVSLVIDERVQEDFVKEGDPEDTLESIELLTNELDFMEEEEHVFAFIAQVVSSPNGSR